jgi:formate dehydrogenase alpha subunit
MSNTPDGTAASGKSICPFCGVGCGIKRDERSGKGTGWEAPVNKRGEICPKGAAAFEVVDRDDRLTQPLVRENGHLVTASWAEAIDRIEDRFGRILESLGPDSLYFFASSACTNEENYLLQKIARVLGTNNVDNCARLCHSSTVAAMSARFGVGAMTNTLGDLPEASVFLITGANPAEQHPVIFRSYMLPAIRDGTTTIHIDPRTNDTTGVADIHLPVRPGYDIPLLNAMAKVIISEDLTDDAFLAERVDGFDAFREHLADVDIAANADLAGVDADDLRAAARAYGGADRAAAFTGMGMSQHHCGTSNVHALLNLALLAGNVGRPGTGVNPLRGQNNVQGAGDVGSLPNVLPGYRPVTDDDARAAVAEEWGVEPPAVPGVTESEAIYRFGDEIQGAFVFGENPAITEPNAHHVHEALAEIDFLVVQDLFLTETAEYADVVLPGSSWAEKSGTVTNTDRQVMRMRPNADPPGQARRDLDILCAVGDRLTDIGLEYDGPAAVFDELTRVTPLYGGMSYGGIGEGSQRWPFPDGAESGTEILHAGEFWSGETTTDLVAVDHVEPADELGADDLVLTTGRVLQQFNSGAVTRRSDILMKMRGEDVLQINPADAKERDIEDGDAVTVANERGEVRVEADVTPSIREGTVFLTFHFADPLTNSLVGDALDPEANIPEYKHSAVRVALAEG